jgi:hypothetical protein
MRMQGTEMKGLCPRKKEKSLFLSALSEVKLGTFGVSCFALFSFLHFPEGSKGISPFQEEHQHEVM